MRCFKGERIIKTKTILDRINYILLGITNIVTVTVIMVLAAIASYHWYVGIGDSNGGGWILMMLFILGIACLPWLLMLAIQIVMFIIGFVKYRRNNILLSRVFGLISSIASFIAVLICSVTLLRALSNWPEYTIVIFIVGVVSAVHCITTIVFSCINISK